LGGAAALHAASSKVSAEKWESYVTSIDLDRTLSSIKGIGYAEPVKRTGAEAFIRQAREDGSGLSTIHPASDRN
jgi:CHASE1-domain containing sensor protein